MIVGTAATARDQHARSSFSASVLFICSASERSWQHCNERASVSTGPRALPFAVAGFAALDGDEDLDYSA